MTVLNGVQGLDMAPPVVTSSTPAGWDGGLVESARFAEREVFLPILIEATTTQTLRSIKRQLAALVDARQGDIQIRVNHRDGAVRVINGRHIGTLEAGTGDLINQTIGLTFRCYDPAWLGEDTIAATFGVPTIEAPFFNSPFFPIQISSSQALGDVVVENVGDEVAWPVITVTGPGSSFNFTSSSGASISIPGGVSAGETITIDTRRGVQTVTDQDDNHAWDRLAEGAEFFPLVPGDNRLQVEMADATVASLIQVTYTPRYLTAW